MSATEAQAEAAIVVLERMINAARNANQAGEDAVVRAVAAPELAKALKYALDTLEMYQPDYASTQYVDAIDDARAALAKAGL